MSQETPTLRRDAPSPSSSMRGRWRIVAQASTLSLILLSLLIFAVGLPIYYARLRTICTAVDGASECLLVQLRPEGVAALTAMGLSFDVYVAYGMVYLVVVELIGCAIGALLLWRKSGDRVALLVALLLVLFGGVDSAGLVATSQPLWRVPATVVNQLPFVTLVLLCYLFPSGQFVPGWTRWLALAFVVAIGSHSVVPSSLLAPDNWPSWLQAGFFLAIASSSIFAQVYRYRRVSDTMQRQQTKWAVFGLSGALGLAVGLQLLPAIIPMLRASGLYTLLASSVLPSVPLIVALSFGIAILRYRLYDIDIIIRRTLVYSTLTLTLGLVYVGCILVSRTLVAPLTGGSELAIVISTLAIAALFLPLRRRIQNIIDRRFYRRKYDATKVLAAFGTTARDETDLDALTGELLRVVDDTMQPEFVGLWLRDPQARSKTEAAQPDSKPPR